MNVPRWFSVLLVLLALFAAGIAPRLTASGPAVAAPWPQVTLHTQLGGERRRIPLTGAELARARACLATSVAVHRDELGEAWNREPQFRLPAREIWLVQVTDPPDDRIFELSTTRYMKGHDTIERNDCLWEDIITSHRR